MGVYIGIEIQALSMYVLVSKSDRRSSYTTESGLKYFIVGSCGSIVVLLGMSGLYGELGSLEWSEIEVLREWSLLGLKVILVGL